LIDNGFIVVAVGGGGIPVMRKENGELVGVEAVIDKDFGSAILASMIHADLFLISTAVEKVAINFNKPDQKWLDKITVEEAKQYIAEGQFAKGSMLPKIEAILKYMSKGGKKALITDPEHIKDALDGKTGTWIVP
ncbi:MAG TPA: carbamate kinase, partial [Anaerolineaceae bacterium]|nr:carbamate kinase [Anaerolineaceae bacterium]